MYDAAQRVLRDAYGQETRLCPAVGITVVTMWDQVLNKSPASCMDVLIKPNLTDPCCCNKCVRYVVQQEPQAPWQNASCTPGMVWTDPAPGNAWKHSTPSRQKLCRCRAVPHQAFWACQAINHPF